MKLSNKIVLVTGGTSGMGLEAAKLFRQEGATVIIVGQNPARLQSAASQLGDSVTVLRGDVSKLAEVEGIIKQISEKFGRIDVLFANAGMGLASPLEAVTEDQIDRQFDVNFKGVFFTIQKAAPLLAKGGSIVVTTSFLNEVGTPGLSILSATKAAVRSLVRSLGAEFAPRGIRVNAVSPGPTSTPFHGKLGLSEKQLNEAASAIEDQVPLHRFGEAREIANAAPVPRERRFLLHDRIGTGRRWRHNAALIFSVRHEGGGAPSRCTLHRGIPILPISAMGQERTSPVTKPMSLYPRKMG